MLKIYSFIVATLKPILTIVALFSTKIRLFVSGRRNSLSEVKKKIGKNDKVIWMHAASLGEYEQGLPIVQKYKKENPKDKVVISFFSPSGYEVCKNSPNADVVVYLPLDTFSNMKAFIEAVNPSIAIFVKYEIWPVCLHILKEKEIKTILISAIFSKRQVYFKAYGGFFVPALKKFSHIFVQDLKSKELLKELGIENVTVGGDTRFDRVWEIRKRDNNLPFMDRFLGKSPCFVFGSSWREDMAVFAPFINSYKGDFKFAIAPHKTDQMTVEEIKKNIKKDVVLFSQVEKTEDLSEKNILIVDTIGILTKIYSYASIAYVGGGMKTGLHNTLEPAVWKIPVIIGREYSKFLEASQMVEKGGVISVKNKEEFEKIATYLTQSQQKREKMGELNIEYIKEKIGATQKIIDFINQSV